MQTRLILSTIAFCLMASPSPAENPAAGQKFPDYALEAVNASAVLKKDGPVTPADFAGKTVVYFFYPKANTPGCTTESCGFRDLAPKYPASAVLVGVSGDTLAAQQKFADDHKLPFLLLADPELKLIDALGLRSRPGAKTPKRATVVVGPDGKVAKVYTTVKPATHPQEVLGFVEGLR